MRTRTRGARAAARLLRRRRRARREPGAPSRALRWALAVAGLAVIVLLYLALGRAFEVLAILVSLPVALVGAVLALALSGGTWNVSSLVGLCGLLGIAVQNGLVLVAQTRTLLGEGRPFDQALREACVGRVRPKLMTAGTAILGILPMVLFRLDGTEIERPLAIVMIGGLVTSTLFTLLARPAFYALAHRLAGTIPEPANVAARGGLEEGGSRRVLE